jgi:hypothetical protein
MASPAGFTTTRHTVVARVAPSRAANRSTRRSASAGSSPPVNASSSTARNCPIAPAARAPCPTTSPTTRTTRSSGRTTVSNQSPPAASSSPATRYWPATVNHGNTGTSAGNKLRCSSSTTCEASCSRSCDAAAARSAAADRTACAVVSTMWATRPRTEPSGSKVGTNV